MLSPLLVGIINRSLLGVGIVERPVGLIYNSLGIVIALVHVFLSFMILRIMSAIQGIDPSLSVLIG